MFLMHRLHLKEYQEMWPNGREEKHRKSLLTVLMHPSQRNTSKDLWLTKLGLLTLSKKEKYTPWKN